MIGTALALLALAPSVALLLYGPLCLLRDLVLWPLRRSAAREQPGMFGAALKMHRANVSRSAALDAAQVSSAIQSLEAWHAAHGAAILDGHDVDEAVRLADSPGYARLRSLSAQWEAVRTPRLEINGATVEPGDIVCWQADQPVHRIPPPSDVPRQYRDGTTRRRKVTKADRDRLADWRML